MASMQLSVPGLQHPSAPPSGKLFDTVSTVLLCHLLPSFVSISLACRTQNLLKQLTRQTPITLDGLPAFVSASRWVIDPHKPWVSSFPIQKDHAEMCCQMTLSAAGTVLGPGNWSPAGVHSNCHSF